MLAQGTPGMKLLFFIYSLSGGGAERVTANLANYWAAKGWKVTVVTLEPAEADVYALDPAIERISLNIYGPSKNMADAILQNLRRAMALRRVLRGVRPGIAVAQMDQACVTMALAAQGLRGISCIGAMHIHPPRMPTKAVWRRIHSLAYGRLPVIAVLTKETGAWIAAHTNAKRIEVIPNPIPWPLPGRTPEISPDSVCKPERKLLLAVGRLTPQKGFDLLIGAFASLSRKHPDWDLAIIGEGEERQRLELAIAADGLGGRVSLPGWAGNMADWYERAQLYVMSSRFEGFPNTLGEAMTYGLPAVSFDCETGPGDIIRDGTDGFLAPKEDVPALMASLDRLMSDPDLRMRFGSAANEIRDRLSLQRVAQVWENLFDNLLAQRHGVPAAEQNQTSSPAGCPASTFPAPRF
jgi:glycosyltransferase involved in cell wall biosynthesis